ncbi:hypothetical protein [Armatimonas rosea]|uniref:Uncharacterized protein n=1 Tax=Armatimonas rosea TaxID=685828 RepID=A0A7W9SS36_ARMRO|nr:hypothetical protein [Armatimonas rosea]MBB6051203.1 hypothetical protein [Armatimonas rosea]
MIVEGTLFGRGRALFPSFETSSVLSECSPTLAALIEGIVREQVDAFHQRQESRAVLTALSAEAITAGLAAGRVAPSLPDETPAQHVDVEVAIESALTAFRDGLFFVFIDDIQCEVLEAPVALRPDSRITFLRLVALAGG